jgi:prepilin-type N-terminal cleavage/methylation domain-containing protein
MNNAYDRRIIMNFKIGKSGFTLIEVVISLAILTIIVTAFLSLFSAGLLGIYAAGDKGVAYSEAQADIESRIGSKEASAADDLIMVFDGESLSIEGGLVESFQSTGSRSSSLETFIAKVPTILLYPSVKMEGYQEPLTIEIIGLNTNFNSNDTTIEVFDKHGTTKLFGPLTVSVTSATEATFTIPDNLINSTGYYIVRLSTLIPGEPAEICRAKYLVDQPGFVTVGENILYVTEDSSFWYDRPSSTLDSFPSFTNLNAICFGFNRYLGFAE